MDPTVVQTMLSTYGEANLSFISLGSGKMYLVSSGHPGASPEYAVSYDFTSNVVTLTKPTVTPPPNSPQRPSGLWHGPVITVVPMQSIEALGFFPTQQPAA